MSKVHKSKVFAATWLYRWQMSQGIIGIVFSALTFSGVFTLLLGPVLGELFGIGYAGTLLILVGIVAVIVLTFGLFLDRVAKFWLAQALVSTTRNPFLISRLYQKEALAYVTEKLPEMRAIRALLAENGRHTALVEQLDKSIARLEDTVRRGEWTIRPGEETYADSR